MNSDKKFAKKLKEVLKSAQAYAERAFPGEPHAQNNFIMGWLESEAGISDCEEGCND